MIERAEAATERANTAAEQTAMFFENIVAETTANPKMLIVHEVMGRKCGWLTAASAIKAKKMEA